MAGSVSTARENDSQEKHAIRIRDGLVVTLALTTGAVDAVTYERLGRVFSSVITGNLALLGIAVGRHEGSLALNGGLALFGYGLGVLVGRAVVGEAPKDRRVWPVRSTVALIAELAVLGAFSAVWLTTSGNPAGVIRLTLISVAASAMGMQSSAVRQVGQMSSTYLTSTLTGMMEALAILRWPSDAKRRIGVLLALIVGAGLGSSAALAAAPLLPVAILLPLAFVIACAAVSRSLRQPREAAPD